MAAASSASSEETKGKESMNITLKPGAPIGVKPGHFEDVQSLAWFCVKPEDIQKWKKMYTRLAPPPGSQGDDEAKQTLPPGITELYDPTAKENRPHEHTMKLYSKARTSQNTFNPSAIAVGLHYYFAVHFPKSDKTGLMQTGKTNKKYTGHVLIIPREDYHAGRWESAAKLPSLFVVGTASYCETSSMGNYKDGSTNKKDCTELHKARKVARVVSMVYSPDEERVGVVDYRLVVQTQMLRLLDDAVALAVYMYPQYFTGLKYETHARNAMLAAVTKLRSRARNYKQRTLQGLRQRQLKCIVVPPEAEDDEDDDEQEAKADQADIVIEGKEEEYKKLTRQINEIENKRREMETPRSIAHACRDALHDPSVAPLLTSGVYNSTYPLGGWVKRIKAEGYGVYQETMDTNPGSITHAFTARRSNSGLETRPVEERKLIIAKHQKEEGREYLYKCGDASEWFNDRNGNALRQEWKAGRAAKDCAQRPMLLPHEIKVDVPDGRGGTVKKWVNGPMFQYLFLKDYCRAMGMPYNPNEYRRTLGNGCQVVVTLSGISKVRPFVSADGGSISTQFELFKLRIPGPIKDTYKSASGSVAANPDDIETDESVDIMNNAAGMWGAMMNPKSSSAGASSGGGAGGYGTSGYGGSGGYGGYGGYGGTDDAAYGTVDGVGAGFASPMFSATSTFQSSSKPAAGVDAQPTSFSASLDKARAALRKKREEFESKAQEAKADASDVQAAERSAAEMAGETMGTPDEGDDAEMSRDATDGADDDDIPAVPTESDIEPSKPVKDTRKRVSKRGRGSGGSEATPAKRRGKKKKQRTSN